MDHNIPSESDSLGLFHHKTILADYLVPDNPVVRSSRRATAPPTVSFEVFSVILSANVFNHHLALELPLGPHSYNYTPFA
jgi:hypothetical protein